MGDFTDKADLLNTYQIRDLVRLTNDDETVFVDVSGEPRLGVDTDIVDIVLNQYIGIAESLVKSYIQSRYELPFNVVPELIKKIARELTYYFLNERKFTLVDSLVLVYDQSIDILTKLAEGMITLDTLPDDNDFQI